MRKSTEFTVSRAAWLRGDADSSMLLDGRGRMCCMGFYLRSCGVPEVDLLESMCIRDALGQESKGDLEELERDVGFGGKSRYSDDLSSAENIYAVNDDSSIPDGEREALLTALLAERGVTVHFVD